MSTKRLIGMTGVLAGLFGVGFLGIKGGQLLIETADEVSMENLEQATKREYYDNRVGLFMDYSGSLAGRDFVISDEDGDGRADIIGAFSKAHWIADGHKTNYDLDQYTKIMTPEIREAATQALKADRDLSYLIANENYRLLEDKK